MCQCSVTNIIEDFVDLNEDLQMYIGKGIENYERVSISSMTVMTVFSIKTLLKKYTTIFSVWYVNRFAVNVYNSSTYRII